MCSELERARDLLSRAPRVLILTGDGLSEESGVPTRFGSEASGADPEGGEVSTPEAFASDPCRVWSWYGAWRESVQHCEPSVAHLALARFVRRHPNALLATQSVDELHAQAARADAVSPQGSLESSIELHGSLFTLRCTRCDAHWDDRGAVDASSAQALPHCPHCQALARPHVVWFGEAIDRAAMARVLCQAELAAVSLIIGTAATVQPAASIAALTAQSGGDVIEINPCETDVTALCSVSIREAATRVLPALLDGALDGAPLAV